MNQIRRGTQVRLKLGKSNEKGPRKKAIVVSRLPEIKGGVMLDRLLGGFRFWNIADLERVEK